MPIGFPIFSPPWEGDAVGRGGAPPAHRAPPLCRSATAPPASGRRKFLAPRQLSSLGGENWRCATAAFAGGKRCRWLRCSPPLRGDADRLSDFLPPGGRCRRQRGGSGAPCAPLCRSATAPPASGRRKFLAPRQLSSLGGENWRCATAAFAGGKRCRWLRCSPPLRGDVDRLSDFLPPLGGDAVGRGGGSASAPCAPLCRSATSPPASGGRKFPCSATALLAGRRKSLLRRRGGGQAREAWCGARGVSGGRRGRCLLGGRFRGGRRGR